jgi:DNA invertase Pin-like site-specific DNA recombinase
LVEKLDNERIWENWGMNNDPSSLSLHGNEPIPIVRSSYIENESGASLQRPELFRLLDDAVRKELKVISLDVPTTHISFSPQITDEFTRSMIKAINSMMMDMIAAITRKDNQDQHHRQAEGIKKTKEEGKYKGRQVDTNLHEKIYLLRVINKRSISNTAKITNV